MGMKAGAGSGARAFSGYRMHIMEVLGGGCFGWASDTIKGEGQCQGKQWYFFIDFVQITTSVQHILLCAEVSLKAAFYMKLSGGKFGIFKYGWEERKEDRKKNDCDAMELT